MTEKPPLTDKQRARLDELKAKFRDRHDRPEAVAVRTDGDTHIRPAPEEDDALYSAALYDALGTRSVPFLNDTLGNLIRVMSPSGNVTSQQYNSALAILASVEPENELEATLASQMVAANECAMRCMTAMVAASHLDHRKMHGDLANKFMRTFTAQVDALSRLRRGGEQIEKHVYVGEGGQAVFAREIHHGRGVPNESNEQRHAHTPAQGCTSLPGPDPARDGVPVPGNVERPLSPARREKHGATKGQSERMEARPAVRGAPADVGEAA